jgi:glycogen phosphorylase
MPKAYKSFKVKATLPEQLAILEEIAYNLHWSWNQRSIELFRRMDSDLWAASGHNPVKMLGMISQEMLAQAAADEGFMAELKTIYACLKEYLDSPSWFETSFGKFEAPKIAYFSMEYGLTDCLPIYSGGLGILAGDHLKACSDLGLPLVGIGLLYQQGYFQQYLNADGWQQETYPDNDFNSLPIKPIVDKDGNKILVGVQFPGRMVYCRIWKAQVGKIPLYLLDTNAPENSDRDRKITYQLYGGDNETRIQQEMILGIGGMMTLRKLDYHVRVCHINEGHAAFLALERIRHRKEVDNLTTEEALEIVKSGTIFTTHTPVPAGIDEFDPILVERYLGHYLEKAGIKRDAFMALGRRNPQNSQEPLNMALMALRTTANANGVSKLHGEVSRKMWRSIWPEAPLNEIPIGHVTNGIHTRSWISYEMSELFSRYLGPNWIKKPADQTIWQNIKRIPDLELWRIHERRRERLVAFTRDNLSEQLRRRGSPAKEIDAAMEVLNPEYLTIGFARRFATYKRGTLLLRDPQRLKRILTDKEFPVQIIFAGKAHPRDNGGKDLIRQIVHFARDEEIRRHIVFLENYDTNVARYLVQGVDVWLNTPRRPLEASGTSGMKILPNGGLNLSVLDGWWCEGFERDTGWAIGAGEEYDDQNYQDEVESKALYDILEKDVIPLFYERTHDGIPRHWISMMKSSMMKLCPLFSTNRMVQEYSQKYYIEAHHNWKKLSTDGFTKNKELARWKKDIQSKWNSVRIIRAGSQQQEVDIGFALKIQAEIMLGDLSPADVKVQVYNGRLDADYQIINGASEEMISVGQGQAGVYQYEGFVPCDESGSYGFSVRVTPYHQDMIDHFNLELMRWIAPA